MKKVVIVGAGIAGLSAGIYARSSGFDVTIYESHSIPGGASTSWRRKGYLFEGGLHWLTGSSAKTQLNRLWREVGALDDSVRITASDPFLTVRTDGQTACLYRDIQKTRRHFLAIAPKDKTEIERFCRDVKILSRVQMPVTDIKGLRVKKKTPPPIGLLFAMLPALPRMAKYSGMSVSEYAERFENPAIRVLLKNVIGEDYNAAGLLFTVATFASGDGGYPQGGSLAMAGRMAKKFISLGGEIVYNTKVEKVTVNGGAATGVRAGLAEIPADAVIITKDALSAVDTLFDEPIHEPWAEEMRANTKPMLDTFVCLGVEADLSDLPEGVLVGLPEPIDCGGIPLRTIGFRNYAGYEGYAPKGCTALAYAIIGDNYAFWKERREDGTYAEEKEKFAKSFIDALSGQFPQLRGKVAVWDVATPLTYERYLGSYKGSWMTVMQKGEMNRRYPNKPESIRNLYFAGQRLTTPGGVPVALTSGRAAAQHLCLDQNTVFLGVD